MVSSGWHAQGLASHFPPNLPIGEVTPASIVEQEASQQMRVRPYADIAQPRHRPGPDRRLARMIVTPKIFARIA